MAKPIDKFQDSALDLEMGSVAILPETGSGSATAPAVQALPFPPPEHYTFFLTSGNDFFDWLLDPIALPNDTVTVFGGAGNDEIYGTAGADNLYGEEGNDLLIGRGGNDRLDGGAGNDVLRPGPGFTQLIGGDGFDTVDYSGAASGAGVNLTNVALNTGNAGGDTYSGIERFLLTRFNDEFIGADAADDVFGNEGADILDGGGGNDSLNGGLGNDSLFGGAGGDMLSGDGGQDRLEGGENDDILAGGSDDDTLVGGSGNDSLFGADHNDHLTGSAGADLLDGGEGFDIASYRTAFAGVSIDLAASSSTWTGVAQGDVLTSIELIDLTNFGDIFRGDANANRVSGLGGNDQLFGLGGDDFLSGDDGADVIAGGEGFDTASYRDANAAVSIDLAKASSTWTGSARGDVLTSIEQLDLTELADTFRGNANANVVHGFGGNDDIRGLAGDDTLHGDEGHDTLIGGEGNDTLHGGAGDDSLNGSVGADTISGGEGFDTASYTTANAAVRIDLTKASSTWTGVAKGDLLSSIEAFDLTNFADTFRGDDTANHVQAGIGDDALSGGGGNDKLVGGTGADRLQGGDGGDNLIGNEGADTFQYAKVEESQDVVIDGVRQLDQIVDFTQGQDKIDLSPIDANPLLAGDQAFAFLADPASHTGDWTSLLWQTTAANGIATINVSTDGDAAAEMQIYMSHAYQFTASDFIL